MRRFLELLCVVLSALSVRAGGLDDLRRALEQASVRQVQEKVYVHTDNQCYFVGDTLWYKAYVVRADNLKPTDMSRILYVELLTPDGLLVERQNIIVAPEGYTCGQFVLQDSLYSGYYEIRAYTRWMLNFGQTTRPYSSIDAGLFYNKAMADEFFREWDGLFSRVIPIYSKPETAGDYDARRMFQRPRTRLPIVRKERLKVTFYPEGGTLVKGLQSRVAFEATDQLGEAQQVKGTLWDGDRQLCDIASGYMGRGDFTVTPGGKAGAASAAAGSQTGAVSAAAAGSGKSVGASTAAAGHGKLKARFTWRGKDYSFDLPKAEAGGAVMALDGNRLTLQGSGLPAGRRYGVSIVSRGVLKHFQEVALSEQPTVLTLPMDSLPAGVSDLTLFDDQGRILADRLFFRAAGSIASIAPIDTIASIDTIDTIAPIASISPLNPTTTYAPYAPITIDLRLPPETTFSLAVRDSRTDEPTYNDGNLMTDLLLSSELRGFIANPAYYFESDDETHRRNLDLLMMVQGWRRYQWEQMTDTAFTPQYEPERSMTVSGQVYKTLSINDIYDNEVLAWPLGIGYKRPRIDGEELTGTEQIVNNLMWTSEDSKDSSMVFDWMKFTDEEIGINHKPLKDEVLVEAEVTIGRQTAGSVQKTQNGRFLFQVPPFYGTAYLNIKAYKEKDSLKKSMLSRKDKTIYKEDAYPDFYVKRDMPFPAFPKRYNFYENHAPDYIPLSIDEDELSELSMENDVHQLGNVNVKGRRRGKRAVDWTKPAFVLDAYDLYNELTDRGLSHGMFNMRLFPIQVGYCLFGNMGRREETLHVDARLDSMIVYRSYSPVTPLTRYATEAEVNTYDSYKNLYTNRRAPEDLKSYMRLSRMQDLRVFTDYDLRGGDSIEVAGAYEPDATVELIPYEGGGRQLVFRDRHIYLNGMNRAAQFYQPDYSARQPAAPAPAASPSGPATTPDGSPSGPADHRRTLYWNPNARSDADGRFTATFYNNSKETRIKLSAAGVTTDGRLIAY